MTGSTVVEVRDLHVRIGGSHILQGVDLTVGSVGVTALLGRNGVGKTTTVKAILGLVPRTGSVRVLGTDVSRLPTHRVVRLGVGYAPEDREVFAGLTVAENLRLAESGDAPARYDVVHALFPELRERSRQAAGTLSGGQQQMVAIARTLLNDNQLLLIDEPTKGLSPLLVTRVAEVLEQAARTVPVLLVEQNLTVLTRLADTVVVLDSGRVAHAGPARELLDDPDHTKALLGVAPRHGRPTGGRHA